MSPETEKKSKRTELFVLKIGTRWYKNHCSRVCSFCAIVERATVYNATFSVWRCKRAGRRRVLSERIDHRDSAAIYI